MKTEKIKSLLLTVFGCFYANIACFAASLFSDYGQIQNVQNYSTNPFWTPNSPYNQKMPQPVYVQGNAVSNDECIQIVTAAVTVQCAARNNCKDTSLSDIRPAIIVQLSGLPNKAYSTACIGYLDTVYESYVKQFGHSAPTRTVAFPESYGSGNNTFQNNNGSTIIQNPSKTTTPSWQQDINERTMELQRLQRQNGLGTEHVYATDYPTNFQDLSFTERTDVLATGYKPYKDSHPYRTLKVYGTSEYCNSSEYANSQECMEYFCSIGGSKATSKECIKWRCSGAYDKDYANNHTQECRAYLCADIGYATQHKETCAPETKVVFMPAATKDTPEGIADKKDTKALSNNQLCADTYDNTPTCCTADNSLCILNLCNKNQTFAYEHSDLCVGTPQQPLTVSDTENNIGMLCTKKFNTDDWETIFSDIYVKTPDIAKTLTQMLISCTTNADKYRIPDSNWSDINLGWTRYDAIYAQVDTNDTKKIIFGEFDSSGPSTTVPEVGPFAALCKLGSGTPEFVNHIHGGIKCSSVSTDQCKQIFSILHKNQWMGKYIQHSSGNLCIIGLSN